MGSSTRADNVGSTAIADSSVEDNEAPNGAGGGIVNSTTLSVTDSKVTGNSAGQGAGIVNDVLAGGPAQASVVRSTVGGNRARTFGGGILNNSTDATLGITSSTVSGNSAGRGTATATGRHGATSARSSSRRRSQPVVSPTA